MSVLNRMLDDLAARGAPSARPALAEHSAEAVSRRTGALRRDASARRPPFVFWGVILAASLTVLGSLGWLEHRARQITLSGAPLGTEQFGPAVLALQAEAANRSPAAADLPRQAVGASAGDVAPAEAIANVTAAPAPTRTPAPQARTDAPPRPRADRPSAQSGELVRERAGVGPGKLDATDAAPGAQVIQRSARSPGEADLAYVRAAELVARGRSHDAIAQLRALLASHPLHGDARAALAALLAEGGDRLQALATVLDGVAQDAPRFAPIAAQLQHESGDTAGALDTLERIPPSQRTAEHHALLGGLAYRAGRYLAAVDAYERAVGQRGAQPMWWLGLGLAQEAAGRPADAHASYTRLAGAVALTPELRAYLVQRLSATAGQAPLRSAQPQVSSRALTTAGP